MFHIIDDGKTYLVGEGEKLTFKCAEHGGCTVEELLQVIKHYCDFNKLDNPTAVAKVVKPAVVQPVIKPTE